MSRRIDSRKRITQKKRQPANHPVIDMSDAALLRMIEREEFLNPEKVSVKVDTSSIRPRTLMLQIKRAMVINGTLESRNNFSKLSRMAEGSVSWLKREQAVFEIIELFKKHVTFY